MKQKRHFIVMALVCLLASEVLAQTIYTCGFDEQHQQWITADSSRNLYRMQGYHDRIDRFRFSNNLSTPLDAGPLYVPNGLGSGCRRANFIVPVVFHVLYDPYDTITNISDAQVQNQLDVLNSAFAGVYGGVNTGIQFCLAQKKPNGTSFNGINHIPDSTPDYRQPNDLQKNHSANLVYYDREHYLNIWIVKDIRDASGTVSLPKLGYSNCKSSA